MVLGLCQLGVGFTAWSTARFYGVHCTPPGINGYVTSLVTMGSPICISTWISHAGFVITYITSFMVASMLIMLYCRKKTDSVNLIKKLKKELKELKAE